MHRHSPETPKQSMKVRYFLYVMILKICISPVHRLGHLAEAAISRRRHSLAAARQYLHREGHLTVPRKHEELLHPAGGGDVVAVRLGVWLTNQKTRRAKLSEERRAALAGLGLRWVE
ncbi:helicase associated domain-containing protein [Streptomyces sp. DSM 42041]|uniref:Helicase associated domain-containing protein n=1 Tax=Streptomyces hazeniae TaxID=3075538 RepID=A0ABU2NZL8_9ACTN|nr:helicase associated domain-containing protein [Streptomyces sp. DSM 42041]MDT0382423.1 helicase associated domain-containing protein [Streptomyces sp. DSM 42041]